jgi:sugar/nucleoside kinase (ribokinase family)
VSRERVLVVGDVVDDILVLPRTAVRVDTDTAAEIRSSPGGSAANVAAWLGALGAAVDFVGTVGQADLGRHATALTRHGVAAHLATVADLPTSTIVILVEGDRRTMFTDRGANAALRAEQVTDALLDSATVLHLTGYALHDGLGPDGFASLVDRAHRAGVPVSVNPGSAGFIADYGPVAFARALAGVDVLIANLDEGRLLTGSDDPAEVADALGLAHPTVVLTLGAGGAILVERGGPGVATPAERAVVVDPTGAGDALTAGFLANWAVDRNAVAAVRAGIALAARAIGIVGGRPPISDA